MGRLARHPDDRTDRVTAFSVAKLGPIRMGEVENALQVAESLQRAYIFDVYTNEHEHDFEEYRLPNGTYDLDRAALAVAKKEDLPRPLIFVTSLPYGDPDASSDPDYTFFFGDADTDGGQVAIISTYNWQTKLGKGSLQQYVLFALASLILWNAVDPPYHDESRGCVFDFNDQIEGISLVFDEESPLCGECSRLMQSALRDGRASPEKVAAGLSLFNRAAGRKSCFIAMPFRTDLRVVYDCVAQALRSDGWIAHRADEFSMPRRITDAILLGLLASDLVVADLTGLNPNVMYELGFAHAHGRDCLMIMQPAGADLGRLIPFDVTTDRVVFYDCSEEGLARLRRDVVAHAGGPSKRPLLPPQG